jgi:hypothetical protein
VTPTLSVEADQASRICPALGSVSARFAGAAGGCVSPVSGPYSSNSLSCAAGHCVLPVTSSRTYRADPLTGIVTVFALGEKRYPLAAARSVNDVPLSLPRTASVCVRDSQLTGNFSTIRDSALADPRSAWIHWGNAPFADSQ